jgi:integrase/recombinase XerD
MSTELTHHNTTTLSTHHETQLRGLVAAWLGSFTTVPTRNAYRADLGSYLTWCAERDLNPLEATRPIIDAYARHMENTPAPRTGEPLRPTSRARRLSALSSFYRYALEADVVPVDPTARVRRPKTGGDYVTPTASLTPAEIAQLLTGGESAQDRALVLVLSTTGLRISEALQLTLEGVSTERGHTVASVTGKGGKQNTIPLTPLVAAAVAEVARERGTDEGPVFMGHADPRNPGAPVGALSRFGATRCLTRMANRCGLGKPVHPHMLRAAAVTNALAAGIPLDRVQRMARHADPRTTMRYNRAADDLDAHPAYRLADELAEAVRAGAA